MSQGKAFTKEQREEILESLRPHLQLGYSRSRACKLIGLDETTLSKWASADEALSMKLQSWESTVDTMVMANLVDAIRAEGDNQEDSRKETSKWWAERKMKHDFSTKTETDLTSLGKAITWNEQRTYLDNETLQKDN